MSVRTSEVYQRWCYRLAYVPRYPGLWLGARGLPLTGNGRELNRLTDQHRGEKAVIIGMGPSLRMDDLERFAGFTTFACNKIFLSFVQVRWRPDYYSVTDILVAENNVGEILASDFGAAVPIHSRVVRRLLKKQQGALFYDYRNSFEWTSPELPRHLAGGMMTGGCSVCVEQIQLAYAMGFSEVYLVGIDFSYFVPDSETDEVSISGKVLKSQGEVNHFHHAYMKPGQTWTVPRIKEQRSAFDICRLLYEADGRKLLNASRESKLDVLPMVEFDSIFPVSL